MQSPRGSEKTVRVKLSSVGRDSNLNGGYLAVVTDCSREAGLQQKLSHQACHDALTGLPNRQAFEKRVAAALADWAARRRALIMTEGAGLTVGHLDLFARP